MTRQEVLDKVKIRYWHSAKGKVDEIEFSGEDARSDLDFVRQRICGCWKRAHEKRRETRWNPKSR